MTSSSSTSTLMDVIDRVHGTISNLNNQAVKEKITSSVPIVIAVGDQSAGKSSIMSKILKHPLPTKSGICTRVAVKITVRRDSIPTSVVLDSRGRKSPNFFGESGSLADAVTQAQDAAMAENDNNSKFSRNHVIEVSVGSQEYDLTLIDLPGLIAYNGEDPSDPDNEIFAIVKQYIESYEKAIIFHVIDATAEPEKIQSLKFVQSNSKARKVVNIFTKSDCKVTIETFRQLRGKLQGKCFLLNGNDQPESTLPGVTESGLDAVCTYLESEIRNNIKANKNLLLEILKTERDELQRRLIYGDLRDFNAYYALSAILDKYQLQAEEKWDDFRESFIEIVDALVQVIKQAPRGLTTLKYDPISIKEFANLKKGEELFYKQDDELVPVEVASISAAQQVTFVREGWSYSTTLDKLFRANVTADKIEDIKSIMRKVGELEHVLHKAIHPVIRAYAERFARRYREAIGKAKDEIKSRIVDIFDHIENTEIKRIVSRFLETNDIEFERRLLSLFRKNVQSEMVNTTNSHYLQACISKNFEKFSSSMATDAGSYYLICCHVDAYLKDQTKYVQQCSYDLLNEFYFLNIKWFIQLMKPAADFQRFPNIDPKVFLVVHDFTNITIEDDPYVHVLREQGRQDYENLNLCINAMASIN